MVLGQRPSTAKIDKGQAQLASDTEEGEIITNLQDYKSKIPEA